jgi:hypothetical protein
MVTALLAFALVAALGALGVKDRERLRAVLALDAERRAHHLTRSDRDRSLKWSVRTVRA